MLLTKSTTPVIGQIAWALGWLMNGLFWLISKIGLPNIGVAIILYEAAAVFQDVSDHAA